MGYMQNNMRPYSQPVGYGMPGQYGMVYGHQMNHPAAGFRPPIYQNPVHPSMQQNLMHQGSGSLDKQTSAGAPHAQQPTANKRQ